MNRCLWGSFSMMATGIAAAAAICFGATEGAKDAAFGGEAVPYVSITPAKGPLRVHPENPRYFTDGTKMPDGSLRAVYLTGSHHWNNLQDSAKLGKPLTEKFDYDGYLGRLARLNHNCIRMWSWEVGENDLYYEPAPWVRTGPGTAVDGKAKSDLHGPSA